MPEMVFCRAMKDLVEIDTLDGCIYDCPRNPGVWSDWCKAYCDDCGNPESI